MNQPAPALRNPAYRIFDELDAISRTRALTLSESLTLEQALREIDTYKPGSKR